MKNRDEMLASLESLRPRMRRVLVGGLPPDLQQELGAVTLTQLEVLRLLRDGKRGSLSMSELAASQGVGASAVTQMVDRLIRDDLVERVADDGDRRVVRVRLTIRAAEIIERLKAGSREMQRRAFAPLGDEQLAQFVALMELIVEGATVPRAPAPVVS